MLMERQHFLKRLVLFDLFMIILALFFLYGPLTMVNLEVLAQFAFIIITGAFILSQIIGFWRLIIGYFGLALLIFSFGLGCITYFILAVILKPSITNEIGTYVGIDHPFNYIILTLYFAIILLGIYKEFFANDETGYQNFIVYRQDNIDREKKLIYLDYITKQKDSNKITPTKHRLSIWLTAITQVLIIKMSWNSTAGAIFGLVSFSLIGLACFILGLGFFRTGWYQVKFERNVGFHPKPALRQPFKLWQTLKESQKNSY